MKAAEATRLRKGDELEGLDWDVSWVKRTGWSRHFGGSRDLLDVHREAEWVRSIGT
jgi:hypothetical protein